jgi:hypothetical protein
MTTPQTTSASYEVGYRKPPRHTQFQKGQSGNPGGRPRRLPAERLEELALYEAYRTTIVMEDGPRPRRPGGSVRCRPAQGARNREAFCVPQRPLTERGRPDLHGRSPEGAAKSGKGIPEARGVRRTGRKPDHGPAQTTAGQLACRPPLPNETKN